jgi:hypothetical protein
MKEEAAICCMPAYALKLLAGELPLPGRRPVRIASAPLLQLLFVSQIHLTCAMKPGTPVFTTSLSLCLV